MNSWHGSWEWKTVELFRSIARRFGIAAWWAVAILGACPVAAQDWVDWREARPFICRANFTLRGYEPLMVELQTLQADVVKELRVPPAREMIELYLFEDRPSYRKYLDVFHPDVPTRRAFYIKGGGPGQVFAYKSSEFAVDVRHETTHAVLHAALPVVPLWLDEGIAEYFEVPAESRAYGHPHLRSIRWNARFGIVPHLDDLEALNDISEMGSKEYSHAWAWVHFMLHGPPEAKEELQRYLAGLTAPGSVEPLSVSLERRLPGSEKRLAQHFRKWSN